MAAITNNSQSISPAVNTSPFYSLQLRKFAISAIVTMIAFAIAAVYLLPFLNMTLISLKSQQQLVGSTDSPILPMSADLFNYEGEDYEVFQVPDANGVTRPLALVEKGRQSSQFIDPANVEAGLITWEGSWRQLEPAMTLEVHPEN